MTKQYGTSWWDTFAPANIKKKHSDRLKEYKTKVPSFRDVDERYTLFTRDRNHIMHNKLIDRAAFITIKESVEQIEGDLIKAIKKIQIEILSKEEKFEIEKQKEIERQMLEVRHLMCCECGTESICINEDVLPIGTCMNCDYVNEVYECDRCHLWFNSDKDGRVIDDIAFCQNCLDKLEDE